MTTMGERWSDERVDELFHHAPIKNGMFIYPEFVKTIKHGPREYNQPATAENP